MSVTAPLKLMTTEDLLAIPDDGIERWIIDGRLHEKHPEIIGGVPMTVRNRTHSRVLASTTTELKCWLRTQPAPHGEVLVGEAGVRLGGDPETTVGIDLVYISAELIAQQTDETTLIDGVPTLAVEILSPSDTVDAITEKLATYRKFRVPLVWIIDPYDLTVTVYKPSAQPRLFNVDDELAAEPHLPGFRVQVARLFD